MATTSAPAQQRGVRRVKQLPLCAKPIVMSTLGSSLLGDADGHRDAAAVSAAAFGPGKFPLVHKVCMGVTAAMCG